MRDRTWFGQSFGDIWMIRSVLQEAIHYVESLRAHRLVEDTGDRDVHERIQAHPFSFRLFKRSFELFHTFAVNVDGALQELVSRKWVISECLELGQFL